VPRITLTAAYGIALRIIAVALSMSNISNVVARVYVDDLDAAILLYQQLAQTTAVNRFGLR
jgi:hypothetical protein